MAQPFDVMVRLGEGRPAVDDVSEYVLACSRLGFQHPDLTTHPAQVRDWYDSEDGLDLRALDGDCAALAAAAVAAEDAARTHVALAAELSGSWSGQGAVAAGGFAARSGHAATTVGSAVRGAADALTALRDELWRAIDAKVAAVQTIDGRHVAQRAQWLAAARTVTTGSGDLASASELVDQQVKPFVANDIGSEWLGAMRAAGAAIGAAYDAAIARTSTHSPAVFDVPGELGPRADPRDRPPSSGDADAAPATSPMAASLPSTAVSSIPMATPGPGVGWSAPAGTSPAAMPAAVPPASMSPAAMPAVDPMAGAPSTGDLGGAAPALGSGGSGLGQQLADLIGGLIQSFSGTDDLAGSNDAVLDDSIDDPATGADDPKDPNDPHDPDDPDEDPEKLDDQAEPETAEEVVGQPVDGPVEPPVDPAVPEPTTPPPPASPPPPESALPPPPPPDPVLGGPVEQTPCEIAADELPQVGERTGN